MSSLHLGTIGWSYNFWKGGFYPIKTTSKNYLPYYGTRFNTVEVDSTFYRTPNEQTVTNWKNQTPENFVFSLKFPQQITHIKQLQNSELETELFLSRARLLGQKLGPLLLQFPPNFSADHLPDLENYLRELPRPNRYVVEVRNKSWLNNEFYMLLKNYNISLAWADSPLMRQTTEVTADFLYIRWEGDRKKVNGTLGNIEADRTSDLKVWAQIIKRYLMKGMGVFGYFGKYYSGYPPSDIVMLQNQLLEERQK